MADIYELMDKAVELDASDIHVSVGRPPVFRINGNLAESEDEESLTPAIVQKLAEELVPKTHKKELESEGTTDFGYAHQDKARFRVSAFKQKGNYGIVMRLIPNQLLTFDEIGLPDTTKNLLTLSRGLVLVTGPTGSGKTTTLATMIDWINENRDCHIVTIEDPIEYYHQHKKSQITQREVGEDVPSFPEAMRRVLRQDPDVILLGEMRDLATTSAAITAAETGHLVFGTLHTTGSARTVDRIIDQYPTDQQAQIRSQLAVSIIAVISQVLLKRCDRKGRIAAFEIMYMNSAIENHIRKGETFKIQSVIQTNKRAGMRELDEHLLELAQARKIRPKAALRAAQDRKWMEERLLGTGDA